MAVGGVRDSTNQTTMGAARRVAVACLLWACLVREVGATQPAQRARTTLAPLITSGRVAVWERSAGAQRAASGAVGAGWSSAMARTHREPQAVILVGTSHVIGSQDTAQTVRHVIDTIRPDAVVVELCRSRTGLMYAGADAAESTPANPFRVYGSSAESPVSTLLRTLSLGGPVSLLLRLLLARSAESALVAADAALPTEANERYCDFRAAREAAEAANATLVLGDRPVEITFERAWLSLSSAERWQLLRSVLALGGGAAQGPSGKDAADAEPGADLSALKAGRPELVADALADTLRRTFPGLARTLIDERDIYLSLTCKSSKAVDGCSCVVGVVGQGHLQGVLRALDEDHSGQFKVLTHTPRRARAKQRVLGVSRTLIDRLAFDLGLGGLLWLAVAVAQSEMTIAIPPIPFIGS